VHLSIFSNVISGASPEEVARKTREYGFGSVQFIPDGAQVGFGFDARSVAASLERWAAAYTRENVEICAVGAYINLLHHDPERRRQNVETFKSYLRGMKTLGCRYISTETGSYAKSGDWDFDPKNRTPEAWDDLRRTTNDILDVATQEDVTILYEPYIVNVCYTPELGVKFVREVGSDHFALLMDPTNWFDVEDARPDRVDNVIRRGFAAEQGLYCLAHAKDVTPAQSGAQKPGLPGPGQGILNYELYVRLLREQSYDGPLIVEHLTEAEVPAAVEYVRRFIE
jgi:sugar phosphate isomerase/epimerase